MLPELVDERWVVGDQVMTRAIVAAVRQRSVTNSVIEPISIYLELAA